MKIRNVEKKVRKVLEGFPPSRDDDMILFALIIRDKIGLEECQAKSGWELLGDIYNSRVPHFTSVLRCRQKLQEKNPELRGDKYNKRHNKYQMDVRNEINDWSDEK